MNAIEANGARIPAIGLGTMTLKEQVCIDAVKTALKLGYRHLDTAERYGNEEWVGEGLHQGLAEQGLKREDVFVTTKVYWDKLAPGDFEKSVEESLKKLKLPWVDLLLIHWNNPKVPLADSIKSLCNAKKKGQAKHVGVANFTTLDARRGGEARDRAAGDQPDRGASLPRPEQGARRLQEARPVGDRLLPDRARQGARQRDAGAHRQGARQERRRRSRCAISCSRASSRSRARRRPRIWRPISRCSTSR